MFALAGHHLWRRRRWASDSPTGYLSRAAWWCTLSNHLSPEPLQHLGLFYDFRMARDRRICRDSGEPLLASFGGKRGNVVSLGTGSATLGPARAFGGHRPRVVSSDGV